MDDVLSVSLSFNNSIALKTDGSLWVWGSNTYGTLGNEEMTDGYIISKFKEFEIKSTGTLTPVKIMDNVAAVSHDKTITFIIKTDGNLWEFDKTPTKISGEALAVSVSEYQAMLIKTDNSLGHGAIMNSDKSEMGQVLQIGLLPSKLWIMWLPFQSAHCIR